MGYYEKKIDSLKSIFGSDDIYIEPGMLCVGKERYPIIDDVIILLDPAQYTDKVKMALTQSAGTDNQLMEYSKPVQQSFGAQWEQYDEILPEHQAEFEQYFDIVNLDLLKESRICDLGCGIGRWSYFLREKCREIVLVDFSDAIYVARRNLRNSDNAIFFMADIRRLPFKPDFCDFLFSLGVLHHMPVNALEEVRRLAKFAPRSLIYLYYALDNRPIFFRVLYYAMEYMRRWISSIKSDPPKQVLIWLIAAFVYLPFIGLGYLVKPLGLEKQIPLHEFYKNKSFKRIRQDAHDRFCTSIEQRYSRKQIKELSDTFSQIVISEHLPYWHFLCIRNQ